MVNRVFRGLKNFLGILHFPAFDRAEMSKIALAPPHSNGNNQWVPILEVDAQMSQEVPSVRNATKWDATK